MSEPRCWCGNAALAPFSEHYRRCAACETLVVSRMPSGIGAAVVDDKADFYGQEYWLSHQKDNLGQSDIFARARADLPERCLYWLRALLKYRLPPARVLELGSAHGGFTALMRWAGFDAAGLEMSPWVVEFSRRAFGVPVHEGGIEVQALAPGSLDVIAHMDVLEHLPDPEGTMRRCAELLKPDGFMLVQTPCYPEGATFESLRASGHRFLEMLQEKEHLYLFSRRSAGMLFERLGLPAIAFEPAIFAHYDMFFLVGRALPAPAPPAQVEERLLSLPSGRLVQALLDLGERLERVSVRYAASERLWRVLDPLHRLWRKSGAGKALRALKGLGQPAGRAAVVPARAQAAPNRRRRVAVDLTPLLPGGENGGAKPAVLALLERLGRLSPETDFVLLTDGRSHDELAFLDAPNVTRRLVRGAPGGAGAGGPAPAPRATARTLLKRALPLAWLGRARDLYRRLRPRPSLGADLLFCPFTAPTFHQPGTPTVSILYDLQHAYHPAFFTPEERRHRDWFLAEACRKADRVVCISEHVRGTVLEKLRADPARVRAIPIALSRRLPEPPAEERRGVLGRLGVAEGGYLLYPANFWPHKNHGTLLEAVALRRAQGQDAALKLVLTGAPGPAQDAVRRLAAEKGLDGVAVFPGYVSDREMGALLAGCRALVFPSLFEGFGMPVAEAMAFGKPVLCSNVTSLPEVAGEAALYFDPLDARALAEAIGVLGDGPRIARMVEEGRRRAAVFADVDRMARAYLDVFDEVLGGRPRPAAPAAEPLTVSVVTPSFNQGRFIERTIQSVLSQEPPVEYVVFDGGSTDGTVEILKKYEGRLRWTSERDRGQTHALNKGLRATSGEVIGWLNSDDVYRPGAVEAVLEAFREHPEADVVYGDGDHIDAEDRVIEPYYTQDWSPNRLKTLCFLCQPAVFFRRRVLERFGVPDESLRYCMDYEFWLRLAAGGAVFHRLRRNLAGSRLHPDAKTISQRIPVLSEITRMLQRRLGRVPDKWIFDHAHAILTARGWKRGTATFRAALGLMSMWNTLRWNGCVSREFIDVVWSRLCAEGS